MMGMGYLIDAANHLKSFSGIDFYKRPFFQNTGDFPLFCKAPKTRRAASEEARGREPAPDAGVGARSAAAAPIPPIAKGVRARVCEVVESADGLKKRAAARRGSRGREIVRGRQLLPLKVGSRSFYTYCPSRVVMNKYRYVLVVRNKCRRTR